MEVFARKVHVCFACRFWKSNEAHDFVKPVPWNGLSIGVLLMYHIQKSFTDEEARPALYVCSTPIGNLQDVSFRLLEVLRTVDVIAAEDTRQTRKLLSKFDIHPPQLISYHEHNAHHRVDDLAKWWSEGKSVAMVSDAGTPGVSDPGTSAIEQAVQLGVSVIPIPGPSAVLAALVGSGIPVQPFTFIGFLPRAEKVAKSYIAPYVALPGTLVIYEAPHRLAKTLLLLKTLLPNRRGALAKELTKRYETFVYGTLEDLHLYATEAPVRGEFVIVIEGSRHIEDNAVTDEITEEERLALAIGHVQQLMQSGMSHTQAVRQVAEETGVRRKDLYTATVM